eukprot:CAMPEP_0201519782 /NCGR_PEP_ID=MMETSP0161_2-20130828/10250_1 /ASSEMBLY_ACC=CAM_ASM_000251 /TAXON_ID=180227 /ORGANISM="Neoparamoeba aestuarina, Strain SoJaBio B1-5/56/2" /LENGTH=33 /DNA_ID= /DNA_START= /DNA_END= /DNA_ORIENTATION=
MNDHPCTHLKLVFGVDIGGGVVVVVVVVVVVGV